jgi:hypothetical protein
VLGYPLPLLFELLLAALLPRLLILAVHLFISA